MRDGDSGRSHLLPLLAIGAIATAGGIALGLLIDWFPAAASEEAGPIDTLWDVLLIVSVPIFVLTQTIVLYSVWRFRMRPGEELKDGPPIHGNTRLEVIWTAIPAIILVALCSYAYVVLRDIEEAEASEMKVRVVGEQFTWTFYYPGDGGKEVASNQLYVPMGKQIHFDVQSKDVLHDFWVPAFRQKIDAVPGITTRFRVKPTKTGTFPVVCAELCGLGHSVMRQSAHVVAPGEFDKWLADLRAKGRPGGEEPGGEEATGGGGAAPDGKSLFTSVQPVLRVLPHALRRERDRHHRPQPRRGPQGQGRGLHPEGDRGSGRRGREGLPGGHHAQQLRRHPPAGGDQGADRLPCGGRDQVMRTGG